MEGQNLRIRGNCKIILEDPTQDNSVKRGENRGNSEESKGGEGKVGRGKRGSKAKQ